MGSAYQSLYNRFARLNALNEAAGMLHWDMSAMMPKGGADARARQLAALGTVSHGLMTDPAVAEWLAAVDGTDLTPWQTANLKDMRRRHAHATAVEEDLVEALSLACSACETQWRTARADADFAAILPALAEVLNLTRQSAQAKSEALGLSLYDSLLDEYEPDGRSADIDAVFADLGAFLPDFTDDVLAAQSSQLPVAVPEGPFPVDAQRALGVHFMDALGFDFNHGRLDISLHPFCGGVPDDVRITTRYDEADFTSALMGVLHETGHAMYERGLPAEWRGQPVGEARGMSVHESQSLLIEMQVCRSPAFLRWAAPAMRAAFEASGPAWEADNLVRLYTRVKKDFIRVDADEVTYPAHVILRYRLEKALIEDRMSLADLPAAWNDGMSELLGITPPDDGVGCLQDIHWYDGAWGYFPTYTLGAMTAAQLFASAKSQNPEIEPGIAQGDFAPLMAWLRENVHAKGSLLSARDLLITATGKPLDATVFKDHLKARYLPE